jgi:DNA polymerase III alpha subunit
MSRRLLGDPKVTLGDINNFSKNFQVTKEEIKVGLKNVKGLGDSVLNKLHTSSLGWKDFTAFYIENIEGKMIPHNGMQKLIRLGLFDGFAFCGKTFTRKSLCEITDIYNTLDLQTKKNFKILMDKIFDDEELTFEELFVEDKIVKLIDSFKVDVTEEYIEKELIDFELEYIGFRISENQERIQYMTDVVNSLEIKHISEYDDDEEDLSLFWTKISTVEMLTTKKGKPYANVRAEDGSSFRIWHNKLQYCQEDLVPGKIIAVKLTSDNFGRQLAWDRYSLLNEDNILKLQEELY